MQVYIKSREDWVDFVYGRKVTAYTNQLDEYYKRINVSPIEIVSIGFNTVVINKLY